MNVSSNVIKFAKVKEEAIIPSKRYFDAGYDMYACFEEDYMIIMPHETKLIPTGIATAFPTDYVAILKERGSTGTKGIGQRCGVIEGSYQGEWFVPLTNHNDKPLIIKKTYDVNSWNDTVSENMMNELAILLNVSTSSCLTNQLHIEYPYSKAISQIVFLELPKLETEEITYGELLSMESERGIGALGSSGK